MLHLRFSSREPLPPSAAASLAGLLVLPVGNGEGNEEQGKMRAPDAWKQARLAGLAASEVESDDRK